MKYMSTNKPCPECDGSGEVDGNVADRDRAGNIRKVLCTRCSGTGIVPDSQYESNFHLVNYTSTIRGGTGDFK